MTELEERIVTFAAVERGMKRKRILLTSRLSHDLGMEGDDAVEFFEKFGEDFSVDLAPLGNHWHRHFGPEGGGIPSLGAIVLIVACVVVGDLLHLAFHWIPGWAAMIALIVVASWAYFRFFADRNPDVIPVTVQDLVDAAKAGKWVKQYD